MDRLGGERGCVESDEISRSNATEFFLACGDPGMDRRIAEGMHEFVETGLKPLRHPIACLQHAQNIWASGPGVGNPRQ